MSTALFAETLDNFQHSTPFIPKCRISKFNSVHGNLCSRTVFRHWTIFEWTSEWDKWLCCLRCNAACTKPTRCSGRVFCIIGRSLSVFSKQFQELIDFWIDTGLKDADISLHLICGSSGLKEDFLHTSSVALKKLVPFPSTCVFGRAFPRYSTRKTK
jgi:hypothetical protein